jgi:hypothetical protein
MNSLKSFCSFAKGAPVSLDHVEKHVEALFRGQARVVVVVGPVGFVEAAEDAGDPIHQRIDYHGTQSLPSRGRLNR